MDLRYGAIEDGVLEFKKKPAAVERTSVSRESVAAE
jgi:hypothetical protein